MHDRTGKGGMRGGPGPPLALWEEIPGWARTIPLQVAKAGASGSTAAFEGKGPLGLSQVSDCLWAGIQGSLIPTYCTGVLPSFPLARALLSHSMSICGET